MALSDELCIRYSVFETALQSLGAIKAVAEDKTFTQDGYSETEWMYIDAKGKVRTVLVPNLAADQPYPFLASGEITTQLGISHQDFAVAVIRCLELEKAQLLSAMKSRVANN